MGTSVAPGSGEGGAGPERQVWRLNATGKKALSQALAREEWAVQRPPPPFLTWLALSAFAEPEDRLRLIQRRREYLQEQVAREQATLKEILVDEGPMIPAAALMVRLVVRQWEVELEWLDEVERVLGRGTVEQLVKRER